MRRFPKYCVKCHQPSIALVPVDYSIQIAHDGHRYPVSIPDLVLPKCSNCGEAYIDSEADAEISAAFLKVAGLMSPEEIQAGRTGLELTQQKLADMMRVNVTALANWEAGMQIQTASEDQLLRSIFSNPSLRKQIANSWQSEENWVIPEQPGRPLRPLDV